MEFLLTIAHFYQFLIFRLKVFFCKLPCRYKKSPHKHAGLQKKHVGCGTRVLFSRQAFAQKQAKLLGIFIRIGLCENWFLLMSKSPWKEQNIVTYTFMQWRET
jgi:hypothetical protein